jgi:hypothetical protein
MAGRTKTKRLTISARIYLNFPTCEHFQNQLSFPFPGALMQCSSLTPIQSVL